jgi:thiamine biosynthesis lipoprotein
MPQPDTLPLGDSVVPGSSAVWSRRDLVTRLPARRRTSDYWIRVHRRAMACRFEITLAASGAVHVGTAQAALDEVDRLENQLSVFRPESTICRVNADAACRAVAVDADVFELLQRCADLHDATGGAFDITSTSLSRCWGFLERDRRLPAPIEIEAARGPVGFGHVALDAPRRTVAFDRPGVELNLGAIGKGYALDRAGEVMRSSGVGDALLSAGRSSLLAIGGQEAGWHVGIVSPGGRGDRPLASVWLRDAALGTSGAGDQFVDVEGVRYGHVIDPRTGWPASGVISASAIAPRAADADALSTAFLIGGATLAEAYCAAHPGVVAVITPDDGSGETRVFGRSTRAIVRVEGSTDLR